MTVRRLRACALVCPARPACPARLREARVLGQVDVPGVVLQQLQLLPYRLEHVRQRVGPRAPRLQGRAAGGGRRSSVNSTDAVCFPSLVQNVSIPAPIPAPTHGPSGLACFDNENSPSSRCTGWAPTRSGSPCAPSRAPRRRGWSATRRRPPPCRSEPASRRRRGRRCLPVAREQRGHSSFCINHGAPGGKTSDLRRSGLRTPMTTTSAARLPPSLSAAAAAAAMRGTTARLGRWWPQWRQLGRWRVEAGALPTPGPWVSHMRGGLA